MPPSEPEIRHQYSGTLISDLTSIVESVEWSAFLRRQGWKPDSLEPGKWRRDFSTGYMVMSMADAIRVEWENLA